VTVIAQRITVPFGKTTTKEIRKFFKGLKKCFFQNAACKVPCGRIQGRLSYINKLVEKTLDIT
jgi:hypothetical protein